MIERWRPLLTRFRPLRANTAPAGTAAQVVPERFALRMADLETEARRKMIGALGRRADQLGCVVIEGDPAMAAAVVIFAGNQERFHMLSAAAEVSCKVIYLQDLASGWYQGSATLPDLETLCRKVLTRELGKSRPLFFGQSSGAYAALVASTHFPGSTVVACAPQTRPDGTAKTKINFVGVRPLPTPDGIADVRERMLRCVDPNRSTNLVIAVSEADNPVHAHFWMDYWHALHLWDLPGVEVSVVNANGHAIVHGNVRAYASLLKQLVAELDAPAARRNAIVRAFLEETYKAPPLP
jgi:hypothetical protein